MAHLIEFAGYHWQVSGPVNKGPGPNLFLPQTVRLTDAGLQLNICAEMNGWACAELFTQAEFGYGEFIFKLAAGVEKLDPWAVLGLFAYRPSDSDGLNEMDIEVARWGDPDADSLNYALWPTRSGISHLHQQHHLPAGRTQHRFIWRPQGVEYFSQTDSGQMIARAQLAFAEPQLCPEPPLQIYLNLWLFQSHAPAGPQQITLTDFQYHPLACI